TASHAHTFSAQYERGALEAIFVGALIRCIPRTVDESIFRWQAVIHRYTGPDGSCDGLRRHSSASVRRRSGSWSLTSLTMTASLGCSKKAPSSAAWFRQRLKCSHGSSSHAWHGAARW